MRKDPKYLEVIERHKAAVKEKFYADRVPDEVISDCMQRSNFHGSRALALLEKEGYVIKPNTFKTRVRRLRKKSAEFRAKEKEFRLSEDHLKRSGDPGKRVSVSVQGIKNMPAGKVTQEDIKEAMRENGFRTNEALRHLCSNGKLISRGAIDTAVYRFTTPGQSGYDDKFAGDYNKNRLTAEEVVSALKKSGYNPHKGFELLRSNGKRITYDAFTPG